MIISSLGLNRVSNDYSLLQTRFNIPRKLVHTFFGLQSPLPGDYSIFQQRMA